MSLPQSSLSPRAFVPALAAAVAAAVTLFAPQLLNDGDTWWHLAAGRWILDHGQVPHVDPFSYTMPGHPWQAHEWLSEVLMALAHRAAGWSGMMILFAFATGGAAWLVTRRLSRVMSGITLVLVVILAMACQGPGLLARPHILVLPLLAGWMVEMLAARDEKRSPRLWMALMIIPWANLHGSYVFGFFLTGVFGLEALVEAWPAGWRACLDVVRTWGLFAAACVAGALVTPHGISGLIFPFQLMTMTGLQSIQEWHSVDFATLSPFEVAMMATLFVCLNRGVKVPFVRLAALLFLLHMALQHTRHLTVLALVAPLFLAEPIAEALGQRPAGKAPRAAWIAALVAVLVLAGVRLAWPLIRVDRVNTPITALTHVPAELRSQPVFNEYSIGGYLIFQGVRPYIDGRADMYGDAFLDEFVRAQRGDTVLLDKILKTNHVRWTILAPGNRNIAWLDRQPNWRRIYADRYAVIHVAQAPPATTAPAGAAAQPPCTCTGTSAPPSTTR